ncbi:MAG TPA: hypothetical protein VK092_02110 [Deinococcales bacterium]|nr:hypothetical protein [Deinococcales bacterium]
MNLPTGRHFRPLLVPALLLLLFAAAGSVSAQSAENGSGAVQLSLEMYVVTDEDGSEEYTASITARAGETVEYRIRAVNNSDDELQAGSVVVTVPIPDDTAYQQDSALPFSDEVLLEFSAGDDDFRAPPVFVTDGDSRRIAQPGEYGAVRWTLLVPFASGAEREFSFRVTVD